jgi:hypothetical protein
MMSKKFLGNWPVFGQKFLGFWKNGRESGVLCLEMRKSLIHMNQEKNAEVFSFLMKRV